jgi:beta-aspartyl-peptidase (threonine type)
LTFSSGGKLTRGWQTMFVRFRESYVDKGSMGTLSFGDLEVTDLGTDSALVLGRWRLVGKNPDSGAFSLVMRRVGGVWAIIHDHTSRDVP